ncbi:hypothetical protein F2Q70_00002201 [Brassica cretica]|uniref:RRM domain-containing protein n=1 Tax=Brassica cretica TaxID=69181 RepID=A0A8S9J3E9_BRACR|nr:hypothetical protein F2Q70_00002201 [Brassica cretica]
MWKKTRKGAIMLKQINEKASSVHGYVVFETEQSAEASLAHNMPLIDGKSCPPRKKLKGQDDHFMILRGQSLWLLEKNVEAVRSSLEHWQRNSFTSCLRTRKRQQKDKVVTPTMTGKANLSYQSVRSSRRSLIRKATCKGKRKQTQKAQKRTVVSDLHKRKQERRTPESFFQPECETLSSPLALILLVLVSFYVNVMELTVMLQQFGYLRV